MPEEAFIVIIDSHTHIYPPWMNRDRSELMRTDPVFALLFSDPKSKLATVEELLAAMDESDVDRVAVLNVGWNSNDLCRETNDYILDAAVRFPNRLMPFCTVQPREPDKALNELERCIRAGAIGVGELRSDEQGIDLADRVLVQPIMEMARKKGLIVSTHSSEPVGHYYKGKGTITPHSLLRFASDYPDVPIICSHWGGGLPFYGLMPEVMNSLGNVWFDSAASPYLYSSKIYPLVISIVGISKVLFGSDYPLIGFKRAIDDLRKSELADHMVDSVLGINADLLFQKRA
jgi:predicted TIM-barrel fold metal-dependent hydrolase